MAVLTTFLLLCIAAAAATLLLLARTIQKYVYRAKARRTHGSEPPRPTIDGEEAEILKRMIERFGEEEERSGSELKVSFRFPDGIVRRAEGHEQEAADATKSTIRNCRLVAERNISGFVVHPEALSCRVQESFVADEGVTHKIEERETRESSVRQHEGVVDTDGPEGEEETAISAGRDAGNELARDDASHPDGGFFHADEALDEGQRNCRKSNGDHKTLAREVEGDGRGIMPSDSDGGLASHEGNGCTTEAEGDGRGPMPSDSYGGLVGHEGNGCSTEVEDDGRGPMLSDSGGGNGRSTEEESEPTVASGAGSRRFLTEEDFQCIGSDSCSISTITSDGYSVRSLVIDADSDDGFLSDVTLCGLEVGEEDALRRELNLGDGAEQSGSEINDARSLDSMNGWVGQEEEEEEARQFREEEKHIGRVIQEANLVISRLSSSVEGLVEICQPDVGLECGDEVEQELRDLEREAEAELGQDCVSRKEESEAAAPLHLSTSDEELLDTGSDGLSSPIAATYHVNRAHSDESEEEEEEGSLSFHMPPSEELGNAEKNEEEKWEEEGHGKAAAAGAGKKEESDELEALWEHQDLIEQLSEELMFVRSAGLETIHEEPQSTNLAVKLGNWKLDATFLHEKPNDELQAFYKIYRERMRKLDILNYQKMYAIDLLQVKELPQSMSRRKPKVASLLTHSLLTCRRRHPEGRSEKVVKELHGGLENVYVGQACLSWEFLSWQFENAQELPKPGPYAYRHYNRVAGEFRHFQVLLRRFLENEPFQVGRVPDYVKSRRDLTDLLQVPVIKVDGPKDVDKGNEPITLEKLNYVMEASIKLFRQFVMADKDETPALVKGLMGPQVELQDPTDGELMEHVREQLHKKEKKLKDVLRVGNCLVKKFKRPEEDGSTRDQYFSRVDMKLVSRVLQMPRLTTEQLVWCHNKLNNITIVERNVHRETAFLPFPCST